MGASAGLAADTGLGMRFSRYLGSDGVSVVSPQTALSADIDSRTSVRLDYGVDAVSAASFNYATSKTHQADALRTVGNCKLCHSGVDAISGASLNYKDSRQELAVAVVRRVGGLDVKPAYTRSQENDYLSQTLSLGLAQDFFQRDSSVELTARHSDNSIQPTWDKARIEGMQANAATLGLTQVLTRRTQARVSAELGQEQGFLSDPYAFIEVASFSLAPVAAREPDERLHAVAGGLLRQSLGWGSAVELGYRYYHDDWGVDAQTLQARLAKDLGAFTLEAGWRRYTQTQAWFFQNFYAQAQPYMTRDLKLAAFDDDQLSLGLRGRLGGSWDLDLSYAHYARHDGLDYSRYYADGPVASDLLSFGFTYH
jgi:hypothetical protein